MSVSIKLLIFPRLFPIPEIGCVTTAVLSEQVWNDGRINRRILEARVVRRQRTEMRVVPCIRWLLLKSIKNSREGNQISVLMYSVGRNYSYLKSEDAAGAGSLPVLSGGRCGDSRSGI